MLAFRSPLVGESLVTLELRGEVDQAARSDQSTLIAGEAGTGKELIAQAIHESSVRQKGPMIKLSCRSIPAETLEVELFGLVQDGVKVLSGVLERGTGGTVFLDAIEELPIYLQGKLARTLQEKKIQLPELGTRDLDVRVIFGTEIDLEQAVSQKEFHEGLFSLMAGSLVFSAPLRERKEDIQALSNYFLNRYNDLTGSRVTGPTPEALTALASYDWPGNVKELENLIERLVIFKGTGSIEISDLPRKILQKFTEARPGAGAVSDWEFPKMALPSLGMDLKAVVSAFENHLVDQALARTKGNKNRASELLSMNRTTLVEKLRKRGMIVPVGNRIKKDSNEETSS